MDLGLFILIDIDIHDHLTFIRGIVLLLDLDIHVLKAFAIEELLDHDLGTVHNVRRHLETFLQAQLRLQVLTLAFLDTRNLYIRDLVFLRGQRVRNDRHFCRRLNLGSVYFLGKRTASETQANKKQHYSFVHITAIVYKINCSLVLPKRRSRCW